MRSPGAIFALLTLVVCSAVAQDASSDEREARRERIRMSREILARAVEEIEAGSPDSAAGRLEGLVAEDPGNADAYYHLGRIYLARGDTAAAVTILEQGMEQAPLSTRIRLLLARQLLSGGDAERAGSLLDGVLTVHKRNGEALYLRGIAHLAAGDTTAALIAWRTSLELEVEGGGR